MASPRVWRWVVAARHYPARPPRPPPSPDRATRPAAGTDAPRSPLRHQLLDVDDAEQRTDLRLRIEIERLQLLAAAQRDHELGGGVLGDRPGVGTRPGDSLQRLPAPSTGQHTFQPWPDVCVPAGIAQRDEPDVLQSRSDG